LIDLAFVKFFFVHNLDGLHKECLPNFQNRIIEFAYFEINRAFLVIFDKNGQFWLYYIIL